MCDDALALEELPVDLGLGIVSNNRRATAEFVADYCLPDSFEVTVGRRPTVADDARRKPAPDLIERGFSAVEADDGLYVGDRETDVLAAERAGLDAVFVRRPHNDVDAPEADPTHVIESLAALPDVVSVTE